MSDSIEQLLQRWHDGDETSFDAIVERVLPWLRQHVHGRLGARLRGKIETVDAVQDAVLAFMRDSPRFVLADEGHLRAILARVVENVLRNHHRYFMAKRRELARERPLPSGSSVRLDRGAPRGTPSQAAANDEEEALLRLALEVMEPIEQRIVCMRVYDDLSYVEIAHQLGLKEDAVRKRFQRAMPKLTAKVMCLRDNDIAGFVATET
ncbi:MAG: sigma-70 family RNA polymerase sigma factor [Planctomycetota bacterium]